MGGLPSALANAPQPSLREPRNGEAGISLIELMIAMMLSLLVAGALFMGWNRLEWTYSFTEDDMQAQTQARSAMGEMVEYIRTGRIPDSAPHEYLNTVIPVARPELLAVWTDVSSDGNLDLIRFRVSEGVGGLQELVREVSPDGDGVFDGASVRVVDRNIVNDLLPPGGNLDDPDFNPLFRYAGADGQPLATDGSGQVLEPAKIRQVTIDLRIDIDPNRSPIYHQLTSVVQPRNLRQY
jgi:hypothetical protein